MQVLNSTNLPTALVDAVKNDPYDDGGADISVTRLIGPPQITYLYKEHYDELTEDVLDRIWSLLGQAVHVILERADQLGVTEKRLFTEVQGWKVSGAFDRLVVTAKMILQDYKVTSGWAMLRGPKIEWEQQLNLLNYLCHVNGYEVSGLQVVAIFRDWHHTMALRNPDYPQQQAKAYHVQKWDLKITETYLNERVKLHKHAMDTGEYPECTNEERWYSKEQIALKKEKRQKAVRVFDAGDDEGRDKYLRSKNIVVDGVKYFWEHRPGEYKRCDKYCPVSAFCLQWGKNELVDQ